MATKTFKQYDSKWGRKNYNGSSTMSAAGCGPTSCACVIYNVNTRITPWTCAKYMKKNGYAVRNNGTAWSGIPACLKNFGMKNVKNIPKMSEIYKEMGKSNRCAVFLFRGGSKGGVTWTLGGHYLAVSGYKIKNSKHYFRMHDPGSRDHDGWYCYENTMKGLIAQVWTCSYDTKLEAPEPTLKKGSYGNKVVQLQDCLNKVGDMDLEPDGEFGELTEKGLKKWEKEVGIKNPTGVYGKKCYEIMVEKVKEYNEKK